MATPSVLVFDPIAGRVPAARRVRYCSDCGHLVSVAIAPGEFIPRPVCDGCGAIHYINPKMVVGCVAGDSEGRVLMCQRRLNPRSGFWTFPSGFLECGESAEEGARRETLEEAQARVSIEGLLCLIDLPHISEVHLVFRGTIRSAILTPTLESSAVALLSEDQIPWQELAFPPIARSLQLYFEDRRQASA